MHLTDDNQSELLKFLEEVPLSGKKIEVSVILAKKDREFFPLIASRGALSFFEFPFTSESLKSEIDELKSLQEANLSGAHIAVHYVRKLYRNESLYSEWNVFESQLVESPFRSPFVDTMSKFLEINKGLKSTSKIDEISTILKIFSNETDISPIAKRIRILAYNKIEDSDRISYLLNKDIFDVTRVLDWSSRPRSTSEFDFILIDWDYKAIAWPYIVSSAVIQIDLFCLMFPLKLILKISSIIKYLL